MPFINRDGKTRPWSFARRLSSVLALSASLVASTAVPADARGGRGGGGAMRGGGGSARTGGGGAARTGGGAAARPSAPSGGGAASRPSTSSGNAAARPATQGRTGTATQGRTGNVNNAGNRNVNNAGNRTANVNRNGNVNVNRNDVNINRNTAVRAGVDCTDGDGSGSRGSVRDRVAALGTHDEVTYGQRPLCTHLRDLHGPSRRQVRVRGMREDRFPVGSPAHVPGVRHHPVL